jgi:SAM-dependent methyltransferase
MKALLTRAKTRVMQASRDAKARDFYSKCKPGMRVLDVGVSKDHHAPSQNHFLKSFRYPLCFYTGLGIDNLSLLARQYPEATFVTYDGGRFPFEDKSFDWIYCNAVIEHVGDEAAQLRFLKEMRRVSHHVFFTTPNKYFPVETHTNLLFIHWVDSLFYWWCRVTRRYPTPHNLRLLSQGALARLLREAGGRYELRKNRFFGLPMTFTIEYFD